MPQINEAKIRNLIQKYIDYAHNDLEFYKKDEGYKFENVFNFKNYFQIENITPTNVSTIIAGAFKKQVNLIDSGNYYAGRTFQGFAEINPQFVVDQLKLLLDEHKDIVYRIDTFIENVKEFFNRNVENLKKFFKGSDIKNPYMDIRFVSYLLASYLPSKYFYVKPKEYKALMDYCDYKRDKSEISLGKRYLSYAEFGNQLKKILTSDNHYLEFHKEFVLDFDYKDESFNWGALDFIFNSVRRILKNKFDILLFKYSEDVWGSLESIKSGFRKNKKDKNDEFEYQDLDKRRIQNYDVRWANGDTILCMCNETQSINFVCKIRVPSKGNGIFDYTHPLFFEKPINFEYEISSEPLYKLLNPGKSENTRTTLFNLSDFGNILNLIRSKIIEYNPSQRKEIEKYFSEDGEIEDKNKSLGRVKMTEKLTQEQINKKFEEYKEEGRIEFITFHPSYSYEDFVEGIRPSLDKKEENNDIPENHKIKFTINDGIFKQICARALYTAITGEIKKDVNWSVALEAFKKHKEQIDFENAKSYVLIIDEINRGDISKIFGELITLIEEDKRLGRNNFLDARLLYSGKRFFVPLNLHLVGTMNTADRSLALVDIALRRRFDFEEMKPELEKLGVNPEEYGCSRNVKESESFKKSIIAIENLNNKLGNTEDIGKDKKIGHAFFCNINHEDEDSIKACIGRIWKNKILPLLEEYYFFDRNELQTISNSHYTVSDGWNYENVYAIIEHFSNLKFGDGESV